MLNVVLIVIVSISLAVSIPIGIYVLFRSQSFKKNYFILMQSMVIMYLFGHLLGLTSTNAEEAYGAAKVLYTGGSFVTTFLLFFICDYCNLKLSTIFVKAPMLLLSTFETLAVWTTKFHRLVYVDYGFSDEVFHTLIFTPGPLYRINTIYPILTMILTMAILLYKMKEWKSKYRRQLFIILLAVAVPFVFESIYRLTIFTGINRHHIYLTPLSIACMSFCLYLGVMRFDVFEIISIATVTAMDHIREGFVLVDGNSNYLSSNQAALRILPGIGGLKKGDSVFTAPGWPGELTNLNDSLAEFSVHGEETRHFGISISPVLAKNGTVTARILLFREVTASVNLMRELENAAYMDALTSLYNRKHFFKLANIEIERAVRTGQSVYTGMLDLDLFKNVNDTYGHAAGDMVLKVTAGVIRQTIRTYDLLGRYGGEEFVLLIAGLKPSEAYKLMERIRENMQRRTVDYEGAKIQISCSIGLAKFEKGDSLESSVRKADEALYVAKRCGRNQVRMHPW